MQCKSASPKRGRLMLKCKHTYTLSLPFFLFFFFFGELMICMHYKYICRETHDTNSPTTLQKASPFVDIYVVYHIFISHICIPTFLLYRGSVASKIYGLIVFSVFLYFVYIVSIFSSNTQT